ncbi:protein YgfX [Aliiglaciecola lipolytica]|uniref:protein YgfX n=1 Tax=Aliiglaciecola lipolytica TaxID=477689 RepID=UPI001D045EB1
MSKYRICISQSRIWIWVQISWISFLITSFWSWKAFTIPAQLTIQWLATGLTLLIGCHWIIKVKHAFKPRIMNLDPTGQISWLCEDQENLWVISSKSKICGSFVCLHLLSDFVCTPNKYLWLAKDQINERDFRRICRTILRCQHEPKE